MSDDREFDPEDLKSEFGVDTTFRIIDSDEGEYEFAVTEAVGHVRPSTGTKGIGRFGEPFWEYKVRFQRNEELSAEDADDVEYQKLAEDEIHEKLDTGEWERVREQAGLEDF